MFFFFYWHFALLKGQKDKKDKNLVMPHTAQAPALGSFPGLDPKARHSPNVGATRPKEKPPPIWERHGLVKIARYHLS